MPVSVTRQEDGTFIFHGRSNNITEDKENALRPYGKQLHNYGLVLRLLPDSAQASALNQQIGNARFMANRYLNERNECFHKEHRILSVAEFKGKRFPELKAEFPFLLLSDKFGLEAAVEHMDKAFSRFYKKESGFPKYASRRGKKGSRYTTKQTGGNLAFEEKGGLPYLKLPKVGPVRFVLPKGTSLPLLCPKGTRILKAVISRTPSGTYEASLGMETVIGQVVPSDMLSARDVIGMDLGLHDYCTLSDGDGTCKVKNPRWIRLHERRLRRFQKALSRKKYDCKTHTGSKNWEKARLRVAKEQRKTACQRKDFQHKLSRALTDSCSAVVCEDLNIKGIMKNRHLSKSTASVGWYGFLSKLEYKLKKEGKHLIRVSRWFPSSQTCHACGYKYREVKDLSIREWTCPSCGVHNDRDGNAAETLRQEGIRLLGEAGVRIQDAA